MPRSLPACLLSLSPCPPFSGVGGLYKTNIQPGSTVQCSGPLTWWQASHTKLGLLTPLNHHTSFYLTLLFYIMFCPRWKHLPMTPASDPPARDSALCPNPAPETYFILMSLSWIPLPEFFGWDTYHPFCSNFITAFTYFCSMECECRHIRIEECKFCGPDNLHIICMSYGVSSLQIYL